MKIFQTIALSFVIIAMLSACGQQSSEANLSDFGATDLCGFLKGSTRIMQPFANEVSYLCDQGGIDRLATQEVTLLKENEVNGISQFVFGASLTVDAETAELDNVFQLFCNNFPAFRAIAPKAYQRFESVTAKNALATGCQYHVKGKRILWYRPAYDGAVAIEFDSVANNYAYASFLTRSISIVKDAGEFVVAHKNDDGLLQISGVFRHELDAKGFHGDAKQEIQLGVTDIRAGIDRRLRF